VVTSRNQLSGLVTANNAHPLTLDLLTDDEARLLLAHRLSHDRITLEPDATNEIITRCAHLPLALAIVAARAATHPAHPLATLAGQLRDVKQHGLDLLASEDTTTDVRAVFSCSYRTLSAQAARLFRLLGIHPGPDITADAAASLAGIPVSQARPLLADLAAHTWSPNPPPAGTPSTTCCAPTPASWPRPSTPAPTGGRRPTGCSTTTSTPPTPPRCTRMATRSPPPRPKQGSHPKRSPHTTRRRRGSPPSSRSWSQSSPMPPTPGSTATPASSPAPCPLSSTRADAGTTGSPASRPRWTPPTGWAIRPRRPAREVLDDLDEPAADQVRAQLHHLGQSAAEAIFRQT
jgi:hypothetical protein